MLDTEEVVSACARAGLFAVHTEVTLKSETKQCQCGTFHNWQQREGWHHKHQVTGQPAEAVHVIDSLNSSQMWPLVMKSTAGDGHVADCPEAVPKPTLSPTASLVH